MNEHGFDLNYPVSIYSISLLCINLVTSHYKQTLNFDDKPESNSVKVQSLTEDQKLRKGAS